VDDLNLGWSVNYTTTVVTTKVVEVEYGLLSVRLSDAEYKALDSYANANGVSMNKAIKDAFFEMLEDQYDLEAFDKAYAEYLKDPKTYSSEEIAKELGIL
jgi:hypothetical protein